MSTMTMDAHPASGRGSHKVFAGIWRLADPKITLASAASMVVGAGAAAWMGPIHWGWLALTVLGIFCVEAAKNGSGEIFDWDSGDDQAITADERTPFSGGKRVIVDGLLTRKQTAVVAFAFYAVAAVCGFAIVLWREPNVLWVGAIGMGLAFFYHAPPFRFSYRGLGEAAVALAYGPVIACGTYLVQRQSFAWPVLWASLPLGIAIMAFLWINEFPDARADELAGKKTWVVRLGRIRAAKAFAAQLAIAWAMVAVLPLWVLPRSAWLGLVGLPWAYRAARLLNAFPETPQKTIPAQAWTLLSFVLMAVGMGAGMAMGRWVAW